MAMVTGKVIRFDEIRGYGFIAPSDGGEDVFLHANEVTDRGLRVSAGTRLGFQVLEGERGLKAYDVRIIDDDGRQPPPSPSVQAPPRPAVQAPPSPSVQAADGPAAPNGSHPAEPALRARAAADDELCEVFPEAEFLQQVTDLLLTSAPELTAATIVKLRGHLLQFARKNGWAE
jgi:CspA family cold shock protein